MSKYKHRAYKDSSGELNSEYTLPGVDLKFVTQPANLYEKLKPAVKENLLDLIWQKK